MLSGPSLRARGQNLHAGDLEGAGCNIAQRYVHHASSLVNPVGLQRPVDQGQDAGRLRIHGQPRVDVGLLAVLLVDFLLGAQDGHGGSYGDENREG